jgi:hypothetical protein
MTSEPAPSRTTNQPTQRTIRTSQHEYGTSDPLTSRQRSKINNFNAYPRITIRGTSEQRHTRPDKLIYDAIPIDLERGAHAC